MVRKLHCLGDRFWVGHPVIYGDWADRIGQIDGASLGPPLD
jgi:hypothetical protein